MRAFFVIVSPIFVFAAVGMELQNCSDVGQCAVAPDHSLLQANVRVHHTANSAVTVIQNRDCAEFGMCDVKEEHQTAQLKYLMKKIEDGRAPQQSQIAFDCGSSGSNIAIVGITLQCAGVIKNAETTQLMVGITGDIGKGEPLPAQKAVAKGGPTEKCTVGEAFKLGPYPGPDCKAKWDKVAEWADKLGAVRTEPAPPVGTTSGVCFAGAQCWAAGTAGNRLLDANQDLTSWGNFKKWTEVMGICTSWMPEKFTSQQGSLTIPGVMEAAMEVETLLAKETKEGATSSAIAFGSAGGSSAQFGICLSCLGPKQTPTVKTDWDNLMMQWSGKFMCSNFHSTVDAVEGDFLNIYTAHDGSEWGVGSFLGTDKVPTDTPIGGMNAMQKGLEGMGMTNPKIGTLSDMEQIMAQSKQGQFAAALKQFAWKYYSQQLSTLAGVRFIAKTFSVVNPKAQGPLQQTLSSGDEDAMYTKLGYAYMNTIGLMPSSITDAVQASIVGSEIKSNVMEGYQQVDEYEWLNTAAQIGFGDIAYGKFTKDVTSPVGALDRAAAVELECNPENQVTVNSVMAPTAIISAKYSKPNME